MRFLVYLYYTQPFYQTSTFGQNHAYCIRIFTVLTCTFMTRVVVLALAYGSSMEDLIFVGMVGLLDPPRDGIQEAVLTLLSTGAHLKMVTGDAEETALAIGN